MGMWVKVTTKTWVIEIPVSWCYKSNPDAAVMMCMRKPRFVDFVLKKLVYEELEYYGLIPQRRRKALNLERLLRNDPDLMNC